MAELKPGTKFRGNVSGGLFEIVKIEKHIATVKDLKTGKCYTCGFEALRHFHITILEGEYA